MAIYKEHQPRHFRWSTRAFKAACGEPLISNLKAMEEKKAKQGWVSWHYDCKPIKLSVTSCVSLVNCSRCVVALIDYLENKLVAGKVA